MRLELHLERLQPGLRELGFELGGAHLPFLQPPVMRDTIVARDDGPVEPAIERKPPYEVAQLGDEQWIVARHRAPNPPLVDDHQEYFQEYRDGAGQQVHRDATRPMGALERRIASSEPGMLRRSAVRNGIGLPPKRTYTATWVESNNPQAVQIARITHQRGYAE